MNAEELRAYVSENVKHDYESQLDSLDPQKILAEGKGRCGHRAAVFQHLAKQNGIESRIVAYRGHVTNQIQQDGKWIDWDCTVPENQYHKELLDHIKSGPVFSISTEPDFNKHGELQTWTLGEYSTWLVTLMQQNPNFLLPRDLLQGKELVADKPNVIIRHDICHLTPESRRAWMGMVHEENQLGLRSINYLPIEAIEHAPLFQMFEHEGFEIGLHSTAITKHDTPMGRALANFDSQFSDMKSTFNVETVQSHGYDDQHGLPKVTYTQLDEEIYYSFRRLVDLHPKFSGRIADSMGVMTPNIDVIQKMQPGGLYYCLWHPEYYEIDKGAVRYFGLMQDGDLNGNLPKLNRIVKDTLYFNDIQKPHLLTAIRIVLDNVKQGTVLDLASGWAILGLFLPKNLRYIAVDTEYKRMKAAQALYQSCYQALPEFVCKDYEQATLPSAECVVLIGWEGDLGRKPDFQKLSNLVKPDGALIVSYINTPTPTYTTMSQAEMKQTLTDHGFQVVKVYDAMYPNGFPREIIHAKKV